MVKPNKMRVVKVTLLKRVYYVIEVKSLFWWIRYNDYEYDTLEQALKVIQYKRCVKEQVWP